MRAALLLLLLLALLAHSAAGQSPTPPDIGSPCEALSGSCASCVQRNCSYCEVTGACTSAVEDCLPLLVLEGQSNDASGCPTGNAFSIGLLDGSANLTMRQYFTSFLFAVDSDGYTSSVTVTASSPSYGVSVQAAGATMARLRSLGSLDELSWIQGNAANRITVVPSQATFLFQVSRLQNVQSVTPISVVIQQYRVENSITADSTPYIIVMAVAFLIVIAVVAAVMVRVRRVEARIFRLFMEMARVNDPAPFISVHVGAEGACTVDDVDWKGPLMRVLSRSNESEAALVLVVHPGRTPALGWTAYPLAAQTSLQRRLGLA